VGQRKRALATSGLVVCATVDEDEVQIRIGKRERERRTHGAGTDDDDIEHQRLPTKSTTSPRRFSSH